MLRLRYIDNLEEANKALENLKVDPSGIKMMDSKAVHYTIKVNDLDVKAAIILKQDMLSIGGEVALPRDVMELKDGKTEAILMATRKQYEKVIRKLAVQPFGLREVASGLINVLDYIEKEPKAIIAGKYKLDFSKPLIMGIINVTPDSFSDGGEFFDSNKAVEHAKKLVEEGADIIDIGGESTRPGSESVDVEEELKRVLPVVEKLVQEINVPVSIDTYKPEVAEKCLEAGVHILNDITALQNEKMIEIAARFKCPVIMMHMQGSPKNMQENPEYDDVVDDIIGFLKKQIRKAEESGVHDIVIDPGIGFGKKLEHNLDILKRLKEFKVLGKPILIGASRKSFIGMVSGGEVSDRLEGSLAANLIAIQNGANIIRVHDVKEHKKAKEIFEAIKYGQDNN